MNPSRVSDLSPNQKIKPIPKARSLFLFNSNNRFRNLCHFVSNHRYFGNSVLICILFSSCMLAAEDPVNYESERNNVIKKIIFLKHFLITKIFFSDFEQIRLLFYECFHYRNMP